VALIMAEHALGERHACKLLGVDRSTYRYEPRPDRNAKLKEALLTLAKQQPPVRLQAAVGTAGAAGLGGGREASSSAVQGRGPDGKANEAQAPHQSRRAESAAARPTCWAEQTGVARRRCTRFPNARQKWRASGDSARACTGQLELGLRSNSNLQSGQGPYAR
jgi:hypothetical protein